MNKHRSLPAIAAVAALAFALTACGGNKDLAQTPEDQTPTPVASSAPTELPSTPEPTSTPAPTEQPSTPVPSATASTEDTVLKGTGVYVGQIDGHSIEIQTKEGPTTFEISEGMESVLEKLNENDHVAFEYTEKSVNGDATIKQRVLLKLSLAK